MIVKLPLTLNEHSIGYVRFNIIDDDNLAGHVTLVGMNEQGAIKRWLEDQLAHNPDNLSIAGGHIINNIGNFSDGILEVLRTGVKKFGFEVDESKMPLLEFDNERPY